MNSLNLISSRVIGQSQSASRPRSKSQGEQLRQDSADDDFRGRSFSAGLAAEVEKESDAFFSEKLSAEPAAEVGELKSEDEKQPLLDVGQREDIATTLGGWPVWIKRLADAITTILAAIGAPVVYVARCFRDQKGNFTIVPRWPRRGRVSKTGSARPDWTPFCSRCWTGFREAYTSRSERDQVATLVFK